MKQMFLLFLLTILTPLAFGQGDAPPLILGQGSAVKYAAPKIVVPNNQATKTADGIFLEMQNTNLLANPSFESSISVVSGWTSLGTPVASQETSTVIHGKRAAKFTISADGLIVYQDSTQYAAQFADGVNGLATAWVKTSLSGIYLCSRSAGTLNTKNCDLHPGNGKWKQLKVGVTLGATSNGVSIVALTSAGAFATVTGTVYVDQVFLGVVDVIYPTSGSMLVGESYWAGNASCLPTRSSSTVGAFGTLAACPAPTITESNLGTWITTDVDAIKQQITNLPAGKYLAEFQIGMNTSAGGSTVGTVFDGTSSCTPKVVTNVTSGSLDQTLSCIFTYTSSGDRTFEPYVGTDSGSVTLINNRTVTTPNGAAKFRLTRLATTLNYSTSNSNTGFADCGLTSSAFTAFGTISNISLQCKRRGESLILKGKFTSTSPTASEARLALPTWNGSQLSSKNTTIIPSIQTIGWATLGAVGDQAPVVLIEPSVSYVTFGFQGASAAGLTKQTGSGWLGGSGTTVSLYAEIPIEGWEETPFAVANISGLESCTDSYACTDSFTASVSTTGAVSNEKLEWITGDFTVTATSTFTTTSFKTGLFTVTPSCSCDVVDSSNSAAIRNCQILSQSTTGVSYMTTSQSGGTSAFNAYGVTLTCEKNGVDYIPKSARAVASDANIATPGVTKIKTCYASYGGASATVSSPTVCSTGTCVEVEDTCNVFTAPSFTATGNYSGLTIANGTFANSALVTCDCKSYSTVSGTVSECEPAFKTSGQTWAANSSGGGTWDIWTYGATGTTANSYFRIKCEGQGP